MGTKIYDYECDVAQRSCHKDCHTNAWKCGKRHRGDPDYIPRERVRCSRSYKDCQYLVYGRCHFYHPPGDLERAHEERKRARDGVSDSSRMTPQPSSVNEDHDSKRRRLAVVEDKAVAIGESLFAAVGGSSVLDWLQPGHNQSVDMETEGIGESHPEYGAVQGSEIVNDGTQHALVGTIGSVDISTAVDLDKNNDGPLLKCRSVVTLLPLLIHWNGLIGVPF